MAVRGSNDVGRALREPIGGGIESGSRTEEEREAIRPEARDRLLVVIAVLIVVLITTAKKASRVLVVGRRVVDKQNRADDQAEHRAKGRKEHRRLRLFRPLGGAEYVHLTLRLKDVGGERWQRWQRQ